jgi:hypothetical protein
MGWKLTTSEQNADCECFLDLRQGFILFFSICLGISVDTVALIDHDMHI